MAFILFPSNMSIGLCPTPLRSWKVPEGKVHVYFAGLQSLIRTQPSLDGRMDEWMMSGRVGGVNEWRADGCRRRWMMNGETDVWVMDGWMGG